MWNASRALLCMLPLLACLVHADDSTKALTKLQPNSRIVNGQIINIAQSPYMVQLRYKPTDFTFCGGSLLTSLFVLSAAHCFGSRDPYETSVVAEATTRSDVGVQRDVIAYVISPSFTQASMNMDYAVLKLNAPMQGQIFKTIPLCTQPVKVGAFMQVSGWGYTNQDTYESHELRTMQVPAISRAECSERFEYANPRITTAMICAFSTSQDICFADSGGPAIVNGEVCGIVSWSRGCADGTPSVYASVYTLRSQIEKSLKDLSGED